MDMHRSTAQRGSPGMIEAIRPALKSVLLALNSHLARKTEDSELRELIRKLQPVDCGTELIRIGASGDGGYLIPDDLEGIRYCFSPGVSSISEFENQLADRHIHSYLADYSVDAPSILRPEFTFDKKFVGATDSGIFITLQTWKDQYLRDYSGDLLLQMDIEGAEYEVILNAPDKLLDQFRIIAIEFHGLDRLFDAFAFRFLSACFSKLLRLFYVVHIHPNNGAITIRSGDIEIPPTMEFSFLNRKRVTHTTPQTKFPHRLDADNTNRKHMVLPKCWYTAI
jgi:hypothetical protein